jgi:hypothetical protein
VVSDSNDKSVFLQPFECFLIQFSITMSEILKTSTIQTARLILRPTNLDDAQVLYEIRTFREIYQWTYVHDETVLSAMHSLI